MSITTRQYAYLSDHSYGRDEHGNQVDLQALRGKETTIGGLRYKVLDYVDRPSGYQGVIYRRMDTGEIIVAHRGTERDQLKMNRRIKAAASRLVHAALARFG